MTAARKVLVGYGVLALAYGFVLAIEINNARTHIEPNAGHLMLSSYAEAILRTAAQQRD